MSRILIAGMGNILRRDDGFGVEVARRLMAEDSAYTADGRWILAAGAPGARSAW